MATTKKPRAPRQTKIDPNETKAQKFARLAENRVPKAIKAIRSVAKLGGAGYERTEAQATKIFEALRQEITAMHERLKPGAKQEAEKVEFKL